MVIKKRLGLLMVLGMVAGMLIGLFGGGPAVAQTLSLDLGNGGGGASARIIQTLALMTVLSIAPSILVMVTSFTRIVVVMSFLRNALGLQQSPPNAVLISLSMFLTFFIMTPTFQKAYEDGVEPYMAEKILEAEAFDKTVLPFKKFMLSHVREKDLDLFFTISKTKKVEKALDTPLHALIPAFMISELRRAFEIGFLLFLPFILIDLVVSSVLMSMGMMMMPPMMISLPFKVIFFVLVDGWHMVIGSIIKGFQTTG